MKSRPYLAPERLAKANFVIHPVQKQARLLIITVYRCTLRYILDTLLLHLYNNSRVRTFACFSMRAIDRSSYASSKSLRAGRYALLTNKSAMTNPSYNQDASAFVMPRSYKRFFVHVIPKNECMTPYHPQGCVLLNIFSRLLD